MAAVAADDWENEASGSDDDWEAAASSDDEASEKKEEPTLLLSAAESLQDFLRNFDGEDKILSHTGKLNVQFKDFQSSPSPLSTHVIRESMAYNLRAFF